MAENEVISAGNAFVVKRLRAKPVTYTVEISHFASGGEWMMGVKVHGVGHSEMDKANIASDLREAADRIENWDIQEF